MIAIAKSSRFKDLQMRHREIGSRIRVSGGQDALVIAFDGPSLTGYVLARKTDVTGS